MGKFLKLFATFSLVVIAGQSLALGNPNDRLTFRQWVYNTDGSVNEPFVTFIQSEVIEGYFKEPHLRTLSSMLEQLPAGEPRVGLAAAIQSKLDDISRLGDHGKSAPQHLENFRQYLLHRGNDDSLLLQKNVAALEVVLPRATDGEKAHAIPRLTRIADQFGRFPWDHRKEAYDTVFKHGNDQQKNMAMRQQLNVVRNFQRHIIDRSECAAFILKYGGPQIRSELISHYQNIIHQTTNLPWNERKYGCEIILEHGTHSEKVQMMTELLKATQGEGRDATERAECKQLFETNGGYTFILDNGSRDDQRAVLNACMSALKNPALSMDQRLDAGRLILQHGDVYVVSEAVSALIDLIKHARTLSWGDAREIYELILDRVQVDSQRVLILVELLQSSEMRTSTAAQRQESMDLFNDHQGHQVISRYLSSDIANRNELIPFCEKLINLQNSQAKGEAAMKLLSFAQALNARLLERLNLYSLVIKSTCEGSYRDAACDQMEDLIARQNFSRHHSQKAELLPFFVSQMQYLGDNNPYQEPIRRLNELSAKSVIHLVADRRQNNLWAVSDEEARMIRVAQRILSYTDQGRHSITPYGIHQKALQMRNSSEQVPLNAVDVHGVGHCGLNRDFAFKYPEGAELSEAAAALTHEDLVQCVRDLHEEYRKAPSGAKAFINHALVRSPMSNVWGHDQLDVFVRKAQESYFREIFEKPTNQAFVDPLALRLRMLVAHIKGLSRQPESRDQLSPHGLTTFQLMLNLLTCQTGNAEGIRAAYDLILSNKGYAAPESAAREDHQDTFKGVIDQLLYEKRSSLVTKANSAYYHALNIRGGIEAHNALYLQNAIGPKIGVVNPSEGAKFDIYGAGYVTRELREKTEPELLNAFARVYTPQYMAQALKLKIDEGLQSSDREKAAEMNRLVMAGLPEGANPNDYLEPIDDDYILFEISETGALQILQTLGYIRQV